MTKYREILRLTFLKLSRRIFVASCSVSKKTVVKNQKRAAELQISWPLEPSKIDEELEALVFPKESKTGTNKKILDFDYIHKELLRNGVN